MKIISIFFISLFMLAARAESWRFGMASTRTYMKADSLSVEKTFESSWIQGLASVPTWEKEFSWSLGSAWKWNVSGDLSKGLHLGGLAGTGKDGTSFIFAGGLAGAHYTIDKFMVVAFDGGGTFTSSNGGNVVNFQLGPVGAFLGASLHFFWD